MSIIRYNKRIQIVKPMENQISQPAVKSTKEEKEDNILAVTRSDQYRTVEELFRFSQPNSIYYTLLILSVLIVTSGLLLDNSFIVLGGTLVTPVLRPLLVIALGVVVGELKTIKTPLFLLTLTILLTISLSAGFTLAMGQEEAEAILVNDLRSAFLYFIVATSSGIAAAIATARKDVGDILPGVSIAVSLVPPLSLIGINLGMLQYEPMRFYMFIFIFNLLGIVVGSTIVFALMKFYKSGNKVKETLEQTEADKASKKAEKKAEEVAAKLDAVKNVVEKSQTIEAQHAAQAPVKTPPPQPPQQ